MSEWHKHLHNLENKIQTNYKNSGRKFEEFKKRYYDPYFEVQSKIIGVDERLIPKRVRLLEEYYRRADEFNAGNWITSQSKFRPTVLEEFCGFLFKDSPEVKTLGLDFFSSDVYAGVEIGNKGNVKVKTKYVDFCIGKKVQTTFEKKSLELTIPVIAIECKTYLDNTMFSEAQFTAQKIRQGSPNARAYILAERNEVEIDQIPSQSPVNQVYILREKYGTPIDAGVFIKFYNDVTAALQQIIETKAVLFPGVFFH